MSDTYRLDEEQLSFLKREQRDVSERLASKETELALVIKLLNNLSAENDPDGIERFNLGSRGLYITREIHADKSQLRMIETLFTAHERSKQ